MASNSDVVIVGGGMVGSLTAAALGECGLDVVLLEQKPPQSFDQSNYDLRVSALSEASERMLDAVGAWDAIQSMRLCPYRRMLVWDSESNARTMFDSSRIGKSVLGHIVENRVIQLSLWQRLQQMDNVKIKCPATIASVSSTADRIIVSSDAGDEECSLLVAADGANSSVRNMLKMEVDREEYEQQALVATVRTGYPQQDITWQRFTPNGPQAFLPLAGHRASIVWYETADNVRMLGSLSDTELMEAMADAFPDQLGTIESIEARGSFPLQWQHAKTYVQPRVALVGDAAHSVHPLAGQGVNMGMLDVGALVDCVTDSSRAGKDIGNLRTLRRYERWRRPANELMIRFLDGIHHAFQPHSREWLLKGLRTAALNSVENVGPLNAICMRTAMGLLGDLPQLAHGRLPVDA